MKRTLLILSIALVYASCGGWSAWGGPLQKAHIPAELAWLVHLDCDALRPTAIGRFILSEMDKPEAQHKLASFQAIVGVDLRTQLHGVTLYGSGSAQEDAVALVYADFDADRLVSLAKSAREPQSTEYKKHRVYSWIDEKKKPKDGVKPRIYAAIHGPRVIFGQREARVTRALDVLDQEVPNLATSTSFAQIGGAGDQSFLLAAARKLDFKSGDPNAAVLKMVKLLRLQVGEAKGQVAGTLTVEANDEEVAGHMVSIGQGLVALMKLQKEKPTSVKLAEALNLKQQGPSVLVSLAMPSSDLIEFAKTEEARKAGRK